MMGSAACSDEWTQPSFLLLFTSSAGAGGSRQWAGLVMCRGVRAGLGQPWPRSLGGVDPKLGPRPACGGWFRHTSPGWSQTCGWKGPQVGRAVLRLMLTLRCLQSGTCEPAGELAFFICYLLLWVGMGTLVLAKLTEELTLRSVC